jgi:hypothetical protein
LAVEGYLRVGTKVSRNRLFHGDTRTTEQFRKHRQKRRDLTLDADWGNERHKNSFWERVDNRTMALSRMKGLFGLSTTTAVLLFTFLATATPIDGLRVQPTVFVGIGTQRPSGGTRPFVVSTQLRAWGLPLPQAVVSPSQFLSGTWYSELQPLASQHIFDE